MVNETCHERGHAAGASGDLRRVLSLEPVMLKNKHLCRRASVSHIATDCLKMRYPKFIIIHHS